MPSIAHYRRAWFALVREAGILPEDRHAVQEEITGKASTTDWTPADWDRAIATLQRDLGQHNDRRAHVREDRPRGLAEQPGTWCSPAQATYVADLVDRIDWTVGPVAYVCRHLLAGPEKALRRARLRAARDQGQWGAALWAHLTRQEASDLVRALTKMARVYPREPADVT